MIKRIVFLSLGLLMAGFGFSQNNSFSQLKNKIHEKYPDISLEDKIIAVNYWTVGDGKSQKSSVAFEKAVKVYQHAKLKGGSEGMIVMSISGDNLNPEANIVLRKDNIVISLPFQANEIGTSIPGKWSNLVFDSSGKEIYRDLDDTQVYSSIHKLITR